LIDLLVPAAALALGGLALLLLALARLRRGRVLAAGGHGLGGTTLVALAALAGAVGLNLHTYQRLTHEQTVAEVSFHRLGLRHFEATLHYPGRDAAAHYDLRGDEWQVDARVLKWRGYANVLGLDTRYRLERLSGRYQDVSDERTQPHSVYPLGRRQGVDLWSLARRYRRWVPWVDAVYGSGTFLPMADGARFEVVVTQSGLGARPENAAGKEAVENWR